MKIFYDWSQKSMIEHYIDACVPIFPEFTTPFECKFVNVNMTSYLVTFNSSRPESFPPCCVFGKPFHPPSTTFLNNLSKRVLPDPSYIYDHRVTFWELEDIPPPTGPFFYAWKTPLSETEEVYSTFAFPGIGVWATQNFLNVSLNRPAPEVWTLPAEQCGRDHFDQLPSCPSF